MTQSMPFRAMPALKIASVTMTERPETESLDLNLQYCGDQSSTVSCSCLPDCQIFTQSRACMRRGPRKSSTTCSREIRRLLGSFLPVSPRASRALGRDPCRQSNQINPCRSGSQIPCSVPAQLLMPPGSAQALGS